MPTEHSSRKILLTADRTLMSDYHSNIFVGFGTCAPPNIIPDWLYSWLFFPPIGTREGLPVAAPYGLRKVEAQLMLEGFDVSTVAPRQLKNHINEVDVLGIHVMDPFGLGPASSTFAFVMKKEPFLARHFRALLDDPAVRAAKKRGLKIIVGGSGAWQFQYRPKFVEEHEIDCVVIGEAENALGDIFRAALDGEALPQYLETGIEKTPTLEQIPDIAKPSIDGLVEIGRGCCRGCQFCSVTTRPLRWYPYEKILREINVNRKAEIKQVCLHSEDVMLYGSKNTTPNEEKLMRLHELILKDCSGFSWSHCSLAAVASKPQTFSNIAEVILQKQAWWGAEVGIETGSSELAKKMMPAKAHPFKGDNWSDVVCTGMGLMHDNSMIPACTLIVGAPEETEEDVNKTIELMDDLKSIRSLIVPLFFVPMGKLRNEDWFKEAYMTELHKELLLKCLEHDFYWIDDLIRLSFARTWYAVPLQFFYRIFARIAKWRARSLPTSKTPITRLK